MNGSDIISIYFQQETGRARLVGVENNWPLKANGEHQILHFVGGQNHYTLLCQYILYRISKCGHHVQLWCL